MVILHLTSDTPRFPFHASARRHVNFPFGTWPIEEGQQTWGDVQVVHSDEAEEVKRVEGTWKCNLHANRLWDQSAS